MKRANHILVGTDFSKAADQALHRAVALARRYHSKLTVLHVIDQLPTDSRWMLFGVPPTDIAEALRKRGEEELEKRKELFEGIAVELDVRFDKPSHAIVQAATERGCGLIVIGRTGESALERLLVGSTAERVLRTAPQMVLVVGKKEGPWTRVVAPIDFSASSKDSLKLAGVLARGEGASLDVLHAYEYAGLAQIASATAISTTTTFQQEIEDQARRELDKSIEEAELEGLSVERHLRVGLAAEEICALAEEVDADLIVMGSVGRSGFKRLLLGNTAERVVRQTAASLLTVKPAEETERLAKEITA